LLRTFPARALPDRSAAGLPPRAAGIVKRSCGAFVRRPRGALSLFLSSRGSLTFLPFSCKMKTESRARKSTETDGAADTQKQPKRKQHEKQPKRRKKV